MHTDRAFAPYAFAWQTMHGSGKKYQRRHAGGNFCDVNCHIVVSSAPDTLVIFNPEHRHGTTLSDPAVPCAGLAITFSTSFLDAYWRAQKNEDKEILLERLKAEAGESM